MVSTLEGCPSERRDSAISSCVGSAPVCRAELLHLDAALDSLLCHLRPAAACLSLLRFARECSHSAAQGTAQQRLPGSGAQRSTWAWREPSALTRRWTSCPRTPRLLRPFPMCRRPGHGCCCCALDGCRRGRRCVGPSGGCTAMQVRRTRERRAAFLMGAACSAHRSLASARPPALSIARAGA